MKNYNPGQLWLPGQIVKVTGPVSFHVRLTDGRLRRCHQDQLRPREGDEETMGQIPDSVPEDDELIPTPEPIYSETPDPERVDGDSSQPQEVESTPKVHSRSLAHGSSCGRVSLRSKASYMYMYVYLAE